MINYQILLVFYMVNNYRQGRSRPLLSIRSIDNLNSYILGNLFLNHDNSLYTILVDSSSSSTCSFSSRSEDLDILNHILFIQL